MNRSPKSCPRVGSIAGYLFLSIGLLVLAGCATGGTVKKEPVDAPVLAAQPAPSPARPTVARLKYGRDGFVITEPATVEPESRRNFEQAVALMKGGDYQKSTELLEKVIARSPGVSAPHVNIAIAYNHLNKPEQAEKHLKAALEVIPGHPVAGNEYGLLLRRAGRFAEAKSVYEKSLASFPEYHPLEKNLAILCDLYMKDFACATEHYEAYGKANPADKQVKLWLADLQTRSGHVAMQVAGGR